MFGLGWGELLVIFVVVLLLFGAKRLPEISKALGQSFQSFKDGLHSSQEEVKKQLNEPSQDEKKKLS